MATILSILGRRYSFPEVKFNGKYGECATAVSGSVSFSDLIRSCSSFKGWLLLAP